MTRKIPPEQSSNQHSTGIAWLFNTPHPPPVLAPTLDHCQMNRQFNFGLLRRVNWLFYSGMVLLILTRGLQNQTNLIVARVSLLYHVLLIMFKE